MAGAQASTGRVTGIVRLSTVTSARSGASVYSRRSVGPRPTPQSEVRNVVVYFSGLPANPARKSAPASIAQKDEQFLPHVVAVTVGATVEFPNQDAFFHNVFSLSRPATFDLGRYPNGSSRSIKFLKPGLVKVYCHIHSQMSAVVQVFDHSWFASPVDDGTFSIEGVPPGEHTLVAWHERIGERRDRVTVRAGATTEVAFTLPVLDPTP